MNEIPIVIAFTSNYIVPACTTLQSILSNSKDGKFHVVCLLSQPLDLNYQIALEHLGPNRLRFTYVDMEGELEGIYVDQRYTVAASFRLLLPNLLPMYRKIIYTDCDIIFQNDLAEIYANVELEHNYLAGVFETVLDFQRPYLKQIGCEPGNYINSGFLIMNLELMRKAELVERFMEASKATYLQFPDQDVLNMVCKGKIMALPPYMNSIRTFLLPSYKPNFLEKYSKNDLEDVLEKGNIHYTGGKPWDMFTTKFEVWWKYYYKLPSVVKSLWKVNLKLYWLGRVMNTILGLYLMQTILSIYRNFKSKNS